MLVLTSTLQENQKVDIWQLLKAADKEFVPALSARRDTTQQNLAQSAASEEGPTSYFTIQNSIVLWPRTSSPIILSARVSCIS
jgi:hypothetical protein